MKRILIRDWSITLHPGDRVMILVNFLRGILAEMPSTGKEYITYISTTISGLNITIPYYHGGVHNNIVFMPDKWVRYASLLGVVTQLAQLADNPSSWSGEDLEWLESLDFANSTFDPFDTWDESLGSYKYHECMELKISMYWEKPENEY